jgi:hypothetical protein
MKGCLLPLVMSEHLLGALENCAAPFCVWIRFPLLSFAFLVSWNVYEFLQCAVLDTSIPMQQSCQPLPIFILNSPLQIFICSTARVTQTVEVSIFPHPNSLLVLSLLCFHLSASSLFLMNVTWICLPLGESNTILFLPSVRELDNRSHD